MFLSFRWFFISLWGLVAFFLLLEMYFWNEGGIQTFFSEQLLLGSFIVLSWIFLTFIWNNKDIRTQGLKKFLLIIEIYLFLLIFLQPTLPLSAVEFLVAYLTTVGLVYEMLFPRYERWKKITLTSFYVFLLLFLISICLFVPYRQGFDENTFYNQEEYTLFSFFSSPSYYDTVQFSVGIPPVSLPLWEAKTTLEREKKYHLLFSSQKLSPDRFFVLESPQGEYLLILPQSQVSFATEKNHISLLKQEGNVHYFGFEASIPEDILELKTSYWERKKKYALSLLPLRIQSNPKFQKLSFTYTQFLWRIFPFWYEENAEIAQTFLPYFHFSSIKNTKKFVSDEVHLKNWLQVGTKKTAGIKKYWEYLKQLF